MYGLINKYDYINLFNKSKQFFVYLYKQFMVKGGLYRASALTFTSLLAMVPLLVVMFSLLQLFPAFERINLLINEWLFHYFIPSKGDQIQAYLQNFILQAKALSVTGIIALIITAIMMIFSMEDSFNAIWDVNENRKGILAFLQYWAMLTLLPLLLSLLILASTLLLAWQSIQEWSAILKSPYLLSFLIASIIFFTLFQLVPNTKVKCRHAFLSALLTALLFEGSKLLFKYYLLLFPSYQFVYGTLASIPIFMLWLFIVWVIILFGATFCHALSVFTFNQGQYLDGMSHAIYYLYLFHQAQLKGNLLSLADILINNEYQYELPPESVLSILEKKKFIIVTKESLYCLNYHTSNLSLFDVCQQLPWKLPIPQKAEGLPVWQKNYNESLQQFHKVQQKSLSTKMIALWDI